MGQYADLFEMMDSLIKSVIYYVKYLLLILLGNFIFRQ